MFEETLKGKKGLWPIPKPDIKPQPIHQEIDALSAHAPEPRPTLGKAIPTIHPLVKDEYKRLKD
jgi:hypothetical protein